MSRTWIRNAALLAAAATGAAGVLGHRHRQWPAHASTGSVPRSRRITSTAPLFRHVAPSRRAPSRTRAWGSSAQRQPIAPPSSGSPNVVPLQLARVAANVRRHRLGRALSAASWRPTTDGRRLSSPASTRCGPTSPAGGSTRRTQAAPMESRRHCLARACRRPAATGATAPRRRSVGASTTSTPAMAVRAVRCSTGGRTAGTDRLDAS